MNTEEIAKLKDERIALGFAIERWRSHGYSWLVTLGETLDTEIETTIEGVKDEHHPS